MGVLKDAFWDATRVLQYRLDLLGKWVTCQPRMTRAKQVEFLLRLEIY